MSAQTTPAKQSTHRGRAGRRDHSTPLLPHRRAVRRDHSTPLPLHCREVWRDNSTPLPLCRAVQRHHSTPLPLHCRTVEGPQHPTSTTLQGWTNTLNSMSEPRVEDTEINPCYSYSIFNKRAKNTHRRKVLFNKCGVETGHPHIKE